MLEKSNSERSNKSYLKCKRDPYKGPPSYRVREGCFQLSINIIAQLIRLVNKNALRHK